MASITRRFSLALLAAALAGGLAAEPVLAQVTPGGAVVGPAGGTASTTAPSNNEGTPAGGTGVISTTRVGPGGDAATPARVRRHRHRHHARHRAQRAARPAMNDTGSAAGLNGSNAPSR